MNIHFILKINYAHKKFKIMIKMNDFSAYKNNTIQ